MSLERLDVPAGDAADVSGCLTKAELRGVDSHGMVRLPGVFTQASGWRRECAAGHQGRGIGTASSLVDGDNGLGPVVGARAMNAALDLAQEHGTGFVGVRNSNHFGPAAYYVEKAVDRGCIGLAISNAPPNMAPFGGKSRFLGTNPVAIGVPAGEEPPLIFDASTSVVARGKIIVAAHSGKPIPEGWAIDPDGYPTTDAQQALAGAVLPFGGPKGSAISFIIDVLCGVLTGRRVRVAPEHAREPRGRAERRARVRRRANATCSFRRPSSGSGWTPSCGCSKPRLRRPDGTGRVLVPGEIELANEAHNRAHGILLADAIASQLAASARSWASSFPAPLAFVTRTGVCAHMTVDAGQTFNFLPIPTDVHFGYGSTRSLPDHVRGLGCRKVFVVTDPGVRAAGIVDRVTAGLEQAAIAFVVYDKVTADSGSELISEGVESLKASGADLVLGIGGGSALDTAKAVAALATNPGSPLDYVGLHKVKVRPLPTIAIPTTAGTGSEVSLWSVFTDDGRKLKVAIGGVLLYPTVAVCDPELTLGLAVRADRGDRARCARARDRVLHEQRVSADLGGAGARGDQVDWSATCGARLRTDATVRHATP